MCSFDDDLVSISLDLSQTGDSLKPFVIATFAHIQHATHHNDRIRTLIFFDECVLHVLSFAKYATAFFNMSRSISATANAFFNPTISAFEW